MIRQVWFQNRRNIEKIVPRKRKNAQNVVFNLKGRILYYFTMSNIFTDKIQNLFKTLKHSLQTNSKNYPHCWAKPCRNILLKPFCFVSYRYLNLYDTISFDMSCFIMLYGVLPLYCVFEMYTK
jgi:hypothetical protein